MEISEKLKKFSYIIMKEANKKKNDIIKKAEKEHIQLIDKEEIEALKQAYERIQKAVRKIDKELNENLSKEVIESKKTLLNKRSQIIETVFEQVRQKIIEFKKSGDYKEYIETLIRYAFENIGQGSIQVLTNSDDITLLKHICTEKNWNVEISESNEELLGGFICINKTKGILFDYSFISRLKEEHDNFLENYELIID